MINFILKLFTTSEYKYRYVYQDIEVVRISNYMTPLEAEKRFEDSIFYRPILDTKIPKNVYG